MLENERLRLELEHVQRKAQRVVELEEVVADLRQDASLREPDETLGFVNNDQQRPDEQNPEDPRPGVAGERLVSGCETCKGKVSLDRKYQKLSALVRFQNRRLQATKAALDQLISKYRGEKETIDAWIEHYTKSNPEWRKAHPTLKPIRGPQEDLVSSGTSEPVHDGRMEVVTFEESNADPSRLSQTPAPAERDKDGKLEKGEGSDRQAQPIGTLTFQHESRPSAMTNIDAGNGHIFPAAGHGQHKKSQWLPEGYERPATTAYGSQNEPGVKVEPSEDAAFLDAHADFGPKTIPSSVKADNVYQEDAGLGSQSDSAHVLTLHNESLDSTQGEDPALEDRLGDQRPWTRLEHISDRNNVVDQDDESGLPVMVSERSLRRKRVSRQIPHVPGFKGSEHGKAGHPVGVKIEWISSSPAVLPVSSDPASESLDLDEVGQTVKTPRKTPRDRQLRLPDRASSSEEPFRDAKDIDSGAVLRQLWQSRPPYQEDLPDSRSPSPDGTEKLPWVRNKAPRPSHDGSLDQPKRLTLTQGEADREVRARQSPGERVEASHYRSKAESVHIVHETTQRGHPDHELRPTSSNLKFPPQVTGGGVTSKVNRKRRSDGASKICLMAEYGEDNSADSQNAKADRYAHAADVVTPLASKHRKLKDTRSERPRRLTKLLEQVSPGPLTLSSRSPAAGHKNETKSRQPVNDNTTGLRRIPLHQLRLEHFKVNSEFNQGVEYAFTETVRGHDRRKCLPGCTRPQCCGDVFRRSIQIGGLPAVQPVEHGPRSGVSPRQEDDDQLLREYLGTDQNKLSSITEAQRQELLLQARTKRFADKYGKHRHAYDRRTTPPGFWRTDMPTTQEAETDREEARRVERAQVEERYREAMRPGGKWVFADERC